MIERIAIPLLMLLPSVALLADEGMWTLDNFPKQTVKQKLGVQIDDSWLDRVSLATTRIEGGCTGSFASPDGLVLTNHHCVRRCVGQMSSAERHVAAEGFLARTREEEVRCQSEQLSVLIATEEITEEILAATRDMDERQANEARKKALTRLEQACEEASEKSATGKVEGWIEKGTPVEPFTTVRVAYDRTTGKDPFRMPQSWIDSRPDLDPQTRFKFVATTDITGGNSGSPVIDKNGNLVGLVFDGNIHAIAGSYWFDETKNRTVAVHPAAMLEALEEVYGAESLLDKLTASHRKP